MNICTYIHVPRVTNGMNTAERVRQVGGTLNKVDEHEYMYVHAFMYVYVHIHTYLFK